MPRVFGFVADKINTPLSAAVIWPRWRFTGFGAAVTRLMYARQHLLWWPLHCIGMPIADLGDELGLVRNPAGGC